MVPTPEIRIVTRPAEYALQTNDDALDSTRFERPARETAEMLEVENPELWPTVLHLQRQPYAATTTTSASARGGSACCHRGHPGVPLASEADRRPSS